MSYVVKKKKDPVHYVDNKTFYTALVKYKVARENAIAAGKPSPRIPEYIGYCLQQISTNLATKGNFVNYSYKDEMISDGIEKCIMYLNNFNPEKSNNPFAYFTRIIYNTFVNRINIEKKQTYVKYKSMENEMHNGLSNELFDTKGKVNNGQVSLNDPTMQVERIHTFIAEFEEKMLPQKKVAEKKGVENFVTE